ncbi:TELT protein, partial [Polypterus senegalus]
MAMKEEKKWAARVERRGAAQEAAMASTSEQTNGKRTEKESENAQVKRIHCTISLSEHNICQKETYDKRHMTYFLIQRSPYLWMKLGFLGQKMATFKLPYKDVLPVQMFVPRKFIQDTSNSVRGMRSQELKNTMEPGTSSSQNEGVTSEMKKRIPEQTQPCQKEFRAASLVSPPNVLLHSEALRI